MKLFKLKWWFFYNKNLFALQNIGYNKKLKRNIKGSLLALLLGFIVVCIAVGASDANPLTFFGKSFSFAFNGLFVDRTMIFMSAFGLAALAIAICFRINFFNIGVPGQMMMAGSVVTLFAISQTNYVNGAVAGAKMNNSSFMIIAFLIAISAGAIIAMISGVLKAYLNLNEVVTTIMMNYVVYYFTKWIFFNHPALFDNGVGASKNYASSYGFMTGQYHFIIPFLLLIVIAALLMFMIRYTTFGFSMKSIFGSRTAAQYSGVEVKKVIVITSMLAGMISGIVGLVFYMLLNRQIIYSNGQLPAIGLNAITISIIVFNDPVGIVVFSLLWASLKTGTLGAAYAPSIKMSTATANLLFGVLIYFAACSKLFYHFRPWHYLRKHLDNRLSVLPEATKHNKTAIIAKRARASAKLKQLVKDYRLHQKTTKKAHSIALKQVKDFEARKSLALQQMQELDQAHQAFKINKRGFQTKITVCQRRLKFLFNQTAYDKNHFGLRGLKKAYRHNQLILKGRAMDDHMRLNSLSLDDMAALKRYGATVKFYYEFKHQQHAELLEWQRQKYIALQDFRKQRFKYYCQVRKLKYQTLMKVLANNHKRFVQTWSFYFSYNKAHDVKTLIASYKEAKVKYFNKLSEIKHNNLLKKAELKASFQAEKQQLLSQKVSSGVQGG